MKQNKLIRIVFLSAMMLISSSITCREWDFEPLSKSKECKAPELQKIENQVVEYLKGSWCSQEKAELILELVVATKPKICVEIGAFTGSSALPMLVGLKYVKKGKAYIVEPWSNQEAIRGLPNNDPNSKWWAGLDMNAIKNQFNHTMHHWGLLPHFQLLKMTSKQAVSKIPNIDFLHLDGNFSEQGALSDTNLYLPKVVPGGYILLSNALVMVNGKAPKMKALWPLFDQCEIIHELENGNIILFKKN